MSQFADTNPVERSCEQCAPPKPGSRARRPIHHRVARLGLCRRCVERVAARRMTLSDVKPATTERWSLILAYSGLLVRALFYSLMFWWASRSDTGASALQGAVAADIITFLALGAFRIPFEGFQLTVDGIFEFVLVVFFLNRNALFSIEEDATSAGISFIFFLAFVAVRLGFWAAEQAGDTVSGT